MNAPSQKGTLLLVDDDEANLLTLSVLLEDEGWKVVTAHSFREASILLEKDFPLGPLDVALVDQNLGDGEGTALIPLLRTRAPTARVILLTGLPEGVDPSLAPGGTRPDVVLLKGVALDELLGHLKPH